MSTIRVTKAQKLEAIKSFIPEDSFHVFPGDNDTKNPKDPYNFDYSEIVAFLDAEIEALNRKNSRANENKNPTEAQKQNEAYKTDILDYLATLPDDSEGKTCSEIIRAVPSLNDLNTQRVSPILKALKEEGRITVTKGKKNANYFNLA